MNNPIQFLPGNPGNTLINELLIKSNCGYTINDQGYRTINFDSVDWQRSVVVFGCSMVFGIGLADSDTITFQLEKMLYRPVINMGVPASSIIYSFINQLTLAENVDKPHAVVNLWTSVKRQTYFLNNKTIHLGPWVDKDRDRGFDHLDIRKFRQIYGLWNFDISNPNYHNYTAKRTADLLWKNTKHIQGSFFEDTANILDVEHFSINDYASDDMHPGPNSIKVAAEKIALQIESV